MPKLKSLFPSSPGSSSSSNNKKRSSPNPTSSSQVSQVYQDLGASVSDLSACVSSVDEFDRSSGIGDNHDTDVSVTQGSVDNHGGGSKNNGRGGRIRNKLAKYAGRRRSSSNLNNSIASIKSIKSNASPSRVTGSSNHGGSSEDHLDGSIRSNTSIKSNGSAGSAASVGSVKARAAAIDQSSAMAASRVAPQSTAMTTNTTSMAAAAATATAVGGGGGVRRSSLLVSPRNSHCTVVSAANDEPSHLPPRLNPSPGDGNSSLSDCSMKYSSINDGTAASSTAPPPLDILLAMDHDDANEGQDGQDIVPVDLGNGDVVPEHDDVSEAFVSRIDESNNIRGSSCSSSHGDDKQESHPTYTLQTLPMAIAPPSSSIITNNSSDGNNVTSSMESTALSKTGRIDSGNSLAMTNLQRIESGKVFTEVENANQSLTVDSVAADLQNRNSSSSSSSSSSSKNSTDKNDNMSSKSPSRTTQANNSSSSSSNLKSPSSNLKSLPRTSSDSSIHSYYSSGSGSGGSKSEFSSLELLGHTVQSVNLAMFNKNDGYDEDNGDGGDEKSDVGYGYYGNNNDDGRVKAFQLPPQQYQISQVQFNPKGCVWDASIIDSTYSWKLDVRVTCCVDDNDGVDGIHGGGGKSFPIEISIAKPNEEHSNNQELSTALKWLQQRLQRSIQRNMGESLMPHLLPEVSVSLPQVPVSTLSRAITRTPSKVSFDLSMGDVPIAAAASAAAGSSSSSSSSVKKPLRTTKSSNDNSVKEDAVYERGVVNVRKNAVTTGIVLPSKKAESSHEYGDRTNAVTTATSSQSCAIPAAISTSSTPVASSTSLEQHFIQPPSISYLNKVVDLEQQYEEEYQPLQQHQTQHEDGNNFAPDLPSDKKDIKPHKISETSVHTECTEKISDSSTSHSEVSLSDDDTEMNRIFSNNDNDNNNGNNRNNRTNDNNSSQSVSSRPSMVSRPSMEDILKAQSGLMSQKSMRRLLHASSNLDDDDDDSDENVMDHDEHNSSHNNDNDDVHGRNRSNNTNDNNASSSLSSRPSTEQMFSAGLMSQTSSRELVHNLYDEDDSNENDINNEKDNYEEESAYLETTSSRPSFERVTSGKRLSATFLRSNDFSDGDIRFAQSGLMSEKSMKELLRSSGSNIDNDDTDEKKQEEIAHAQVTRPPSPSAAGATDDEEANFQPEDFIEALKSKKRPEGEIRSARRGIMSRNSVMVAMKEVSSLRVQLVDSDTAAMDDDEDITHAMRKNHRPEGEIRQARKGMVSSTTMLNLRRRSSIDETRRNCLDEDIRDRVPLGVTFAETKGDDSTDVLPMNSDDASAEDVLVFSSNDLLKVQKLDILTEGQYFLGISMLVYMYSHLRETCRMGHTRVNMDDIDVRSFQSDYKSTCAESYLSTTKTAGSIIRCVIDELDVEDENDEEHELLGGDREYEKSIMSEFRKWIEDSKVSQLDEETEKMITELKRKVARHRWKRAISAVRLSYKLSGGKRPKFESPVAAPGCENENRFVDMNQLMSEALRKQPKYFRDGSVMNNLIESGIEVVWFSDLTQSDVVYGICCQREEKKVTVVFRGTVTSHNWKMNLKFDTNEYRNPIKADYPGREDELSLHSGFALYMMRKRKDTGISKLQEIFDKIDEIGREIAPKGDYKLSITGHSLGGALATLMGFYVAAKPRFSNLKTIYIWTFAAPRVGTQAFIHAYQYLERIGKIRHARFSCTNDLVPLVPFCNFEKDDLQFYKHVGMRVQLHGVGRIGKWRLRNALDVTYPLSHDWQSELKRVFMNNIFANMNTIKGFGRNHTLTEMQKRIHFASEYKKVLGSGVYFADQKRNRIKSLDEYYAIRANIANSCEHMEIINDVASKTCPKPTHKQPIVLLIVSILSVTWVFLLASVADNMDVSLIHLIATSIWSVAHIPIHAVVSIGEKCSQLYPAGQFRYRLDESAFIRKNDQAVRIDVPRRHFNSNTISLMHDMAKGRAMNLVLKQKKSIQDAHKVIENSNRKLELFNKTSNRLYYLASFIDKAFQAELDIGTPARDNEQIVQPAENQELEVQRNEESLPDQKGNEAAAEAALVTKRIALESVMKPLKDYSTSVTFAPTLEDGRYLVGVGVRKKSILSIYAVAMYASPSVLQAVFPFPGGTQERRTAVRNAAKTFGSSSPTTSFVLQMVYKADAKTIAGAIADSVKPRYNGSTSDINSLESLIFEGVNGKGGYATKGTIFRFDCSESGVTVSVDGSLQGKAAFEGMGSAFVDVFLDDNAVSPTLVDSSLNTWRTEESKSLSASLFELNEEIRHLRDSVVSELPSDHDAIATTNILKGDEETKQASDATQQAIESKMTPLKDYSTSITFSPTLEDGQYLVGVGVRKKSILSIYAVAMYAHATVVETLFPFVCEKHQTKESVSSLRNAARTFGSSSPTTSFVLQMVYKADAKTIAGAIADSVKPRYNGSTSDINSLENLIFEGVNGKGGYATKGTIFRFDCSESGVTVSVDGSLQGKAAFEGMGSAFVDVFLDDNAVSPTLVSSCLSTWCGQSA